MGIPTLCRARSAAIPHDVVIWAVCATTIALVLLRPRGISEWVWATTGAIALTAFGLVPISRVGLAIGKGTDVYLFLAGMMVLAEVARREGVFDWVASHAVRIAGGSRFALFALVYAVGIVVTVVLSNDATAVVLTPAVAAVVRKAKAEPLPYLFACAFIANAASFALPISNPANLVVFAGAMPPLARWLAAFTLPSLAAIVTTFVVLVLISRAELRGAAEREVEHPPLGDTGRIALGGIALAAAALVVASAFGAPLGVTTFVCAAIVFAIVAIRDRTAFGDVAKNVSWSILAFVAALFVLVEALDATGLIVLSERASSALAGLSEPFGNLAGAGIAALGSNLINNLPSGLIAGASVAHLSAHAEFRSAVAIGIDLGPNLSVTGSLATVLWLAALRRENIEISAWRFLRTGALVMPPALILAVLCIRS